MRQLCLGAALGAFTTLLILRPQPPETPMTRAVPNLLQRVERLRDAWMAHPRSWDREHQYLTALVNAEYTRRVVRTGQDTPGTSDEPPPVMVLELAADLRERARTTRQHTLCDCLDSQIRNLQPE